MNYVPLYFLLDDCCVQVGSLEEVLVKMQSADGEGEWGSVMFVPAGAISVPSK